MYESGRSADDIVSADGLAQNSDEGALLAIVRDVIAKNSDAAAQYRAGKSQTFGYLVGQVMKGSGGKANPKLANELLEASSHTRDSRNRPGFARPWNQSPVSLAPLLAYLAAAVVTTWPLAVHPASLLGAPSGPGDPFLNLWILGWDMQAVLSDPASILTGRVFNANIFHPAAGTLAYSDHLLLQSVLLATVSRSRTMSSSATTCC